MTSRMSIIARLAAPNVIGFVAQLVMSVIDGVVAAQLGSSALAAVALVLPFQMLLTQAANGAFGAATAGMIARALGAADRERAHSEALHALATAAAISGVLTVFGFTCVPTLLQRLGGSGAMLEQAVNYAELLFAGCLIIWLNAALGGMARGAGRMWLPAVTMLFAAFIHLLLSRPLALGIGNFQGLGIRGIAISWILSSAVSLVPLAYGLYRVKLIGWARHFAWRLDRMSGLMSVALPAIGSTALSNICVMVATKVASRYGEQSLIGFGLGARLEYVLVPFAFSIGMALIALSGQARGAGQHCKARQLALSGVIGSGVLVGVIGSAVAIYPELWLQFFKISDGAHATAVHYLHILGPFYMFFGIGLTSFFAAQAFGRMLPAVAGAFLRLVVIWAGGIISLKLYPDNIEAFFWSVAIAFTLYGLANLMAIMSLSAVRKEEQPIQPLLN